MGDVVIECLHGDVLNNDVEKATISIKSVLRSQERKHDDAILGVQKQVDPLARMKSKMGRNKQVVVVRIADIKAAAEKIVRSQPPA